jgi:5-methylcytosine-specific restriction endonuclease McrA
MSDWISSAHTKLRRTMRRYDRMQAAKAKGTHTPTEWKLLHDVFRRCLQCGTPYANLKEGIATKDHIVGISYGGCDCLANLQPACSKCNSAGIGEDLRYRELPGWQTLLLHKMGAYF